MLSLTSDEWSLRVYRTHLSIKMHWVDREWCSCPVVLDPVRFIKPHNDETTLRLLFQLLSIWNLLQKLKAFATNIDSDVYVAMVRLTGMLNIRNNSSQTVSKVHVLCFADAIKFAIKDCLTEAHENVNQIRSLLSTMRSSVKRRNIYETIEQPYRAYNCTTAIIACSKNWWPYTLLMIYKAFKGRTMLNSIPSKANNLWSLAITNDVQTNP